MPAKKKRSSKNGQKVFKKTDLVDYVMKKNKDLTKTQARKIVGDVFDGLTTGIKRSDRVTITGFGSYTKKKIPARRGGKMVKNPFTGELVKQKPRPAQTKVKFRAGKALK